jgi:ABC-type cobalamin transport system permease subunit
MLRNIFHIDTAFAGVITDAPPISSILSNVLNFLLSIIGVLGIIGLVISGILYLTAAGDEKRMRVAKNAMIGSVIGIIIALGALILTGQIATFFS